MNHHFAVVPHDLKFKFQAGTSRGVLDTKKSYFICLNTFEKNVWGEVSIIPKLSPEDTPQFERDLYALIYRLNKIALPKSKTDIDAFLAGLNVDHYPALRFGIEMTLYDFFSIVSNHYFDSSFFDGSAAIPINGLIWMGDTSFMIKQIEEKLEKGFTCLKMKIGAIGIDAELAVLEDIRTQFDKDALTLRVDANGAFDYDTAIEVLNELKRLDIHSIEQPIKQGNYEAMHELCAQNIIPIALDEELIGIDHLDEKKLLLSKVEPQYIILKPSLLGGFSKTDEWINLAESMNIGWWITSALEANVGLNAVSQYAASKSVTMHQGLGTGQLFENNIPSALEIKGEGLWYDKNQQWDFSLLA